MNLTLSNDDLKVAIKEVIQEMGIASENIDGRTINLEEFRKKYCGGRSKEWVKQEILYKFEPEWVANIYPGQGGHFIIFEKQAAEWMEVNKFRIDWNAKLIV